MDTLSDRLKIAMERAEVSQAELARKIGIKPAALQYLLSSGAQASRFTFELAHALDVKTEWLAAGAGNMTTEEDTEYQLFLKQKQVPLITFDDIIFWLREKSLHHDWPIFLIDSDIGDSSFAIKINNAAMKPLLNKDEIIIFDTKRQPKDGDLVIVKLKEQDEIIIRTFSLKEKPELVPANVHMYKSIPFNRGDTILGTAFEKRTAL